MTGRILQTIFAPSTKEATALTEADAGTNMSNLLALLTHLLLPLPPTYLLPLFPKEI